VDNRGDLIDEQHNPLLQNLGSIRKLPNITEPKNCDEFLP
jgi:hypothetical protein